MNSKSFKFFSFGVLVILVIGLFALVTPQGSVSAQTPQPPKDTPKERDGRGLIGRRLEWAYKMEQHNVREQAFLFKRMDEGIKNAEKLIERANAKGTDTKALAAALAEFKTKKADAFKSHEAAVAVLKTHAGFAENGKVTDPEKARETLKVAHENLEKARTIGGEAFRKFTQTVREWLKNNKPAGDK